MSESSEHGVDEPGIEFYISYYEKYYELLSKYNGVFEWVYNNEDQLPYLDTVDEIKTSYEESLK